MATNVTTLENIIVDRDYTDIYAVKETAMAKLGPKYFEDVTLAALNIGELGFLLEEIGNITEDSFNTGSILINEAFPNKATIPESIYTHAAVFQLSNTFVHPAICSFILLMQKKDILENGSTSGNITTFFLDKDTLFQVDNIPFVLDYDIKITAISSQDTPSDEPSYVFRAQYITDDGINSIANMANPYLVIRQIPGDKILLTFTARQVTRNIINDTIISNTRVNYPVLEYEFEDKLAGFDIFYKAPTSPEWVQLETRIKFSLPSTNPFCFYSLKDEQTLQISFPSSDLYFQPEFNSKIKLVLYTSLGKNGNFEAYTGNKIEIQINDERYEYNNKLTLAAMTVSDSDGGTERMNLEALQALTVESYSTATEISTEKDLETYFYDYKYRNGDEIKVIKRRDDVTERLFSAFLIIKNGEYIYPTNTLNLNINQDQFDMVDSNNKFTLRAGHVFVYEDDSLNTVKLVEGVMAYDKEALEELMEEYEFVYTLPFTLSITKTPNLVGLYQSTVDELIQLDYKWSSDTAAEQFITTKLYLERKIDGNFEYNMYLRITTASSLDSFVTNLNTYEDNDVRIVAAFTDTSGTEIGYVELYPTEVDPEDSSMVTFGIKLLTDDHISSKETVAILNAHPKNPDQTDPVMVPIDEEHVNFYILYRDTLTEDNGFNIYFDDMEGYGVVNIYFTNTSYLTFIKPMDIMRSYVEFSNIGSDEEPLISIDVNLLPMVYADLINDEDGFSKFVDRFTKEYNYLVESLLPDDRAAGKLRGNTNIDLKFYNTYGKSVNYYIGDDKELIDKVNLEIKFKVILIEGTDEIEARNQLVHYIKEYIEKVNKDGTNNLYISNLIRNIENSFAFVHHLKFMGINNYDTSYQTISIKERNLANLNKEERRLYVPEILVVDSSNVKLSITFE